MGSESLHVDFDAFASQKAALVRHLEACRTQHENACQSIEHLVHTQMTALPSIHPPLLELVSWMRERHAETYHVLSEEWLHDIDGFVASADDIHAEAITKFAEQ